MIDMKKYYNLLDYAVEVTCTDGQVIRGEWLDWTSAEDNEPDGESITVKKNTGEQVEIFVEEIKAIQKAHI